MKKWFEAENTNKDSAIVVSTRIRLARNLVDIPFPGIMNDDEKKEVISRVDKALEKASFGNSITLKKINMEKLSDTEAFAMAERRVISPEFANNRKGRAIYLSDDESVAVIVNEEDHIRIQVLSVGSELPVCLKLADEIDTFLDEKLGFAFDASLGYLTQCPTNLGTGLRASVMLHLPMMEGKRMMENLTETISKLGMTVRGSMGEDSDSQGALYQISNQVTLGISEQTAINNLMSIVNQVIRQEENIRNNVYQNDKIGTEDKIYRTFGLVSNARLLSGKELSGFLSVIRLGASLGILNIKNEVLNSLLFETGANNIVLNTGASLSLQRDEKRAETVREKIN